ncbi:MAG: DHH family phosphoesterase [Lachnospiraceae bacterium]|nr:DHH family phosphoesterase [Lachnospiraceae bacterium]
MDTNTEKKPKKIKIGYLLKGYVVFAIILGVVFLGLCVGLFFIDMKAAGIAFAVLVAMAIATVLFFHYVNKRLAEGLIKFARNYENLEREMISDFPIPYAITDMTGDILIYNDYFSRLYSDTPGSNNLCDVFHELEAKDLVFEGITKNISVVYDNRDYRLHIKKLLVDNELLEEKLIILPRKELFVYTVYLFDETEIVNMVRKGIEEQMVIGSIYIDNYEETLEQETDVKKSFIIAMIDRAVSNYFQNTGGVVRKTETDRYFVIFKRKYLASFQRDKFDLLDEVKSIETDSGIPVTLSIGIGVGEDYLKNNESARLALELALGRGGDQAVVRDGERVYYYGGKTKQVEKNSRVKARIKAMALREVLVNQDRVVIMGHKNCDIDSFGAAIGIYRAARTLGKRAYIVIDMPTSSIQPILPFFLEDPEYKEVFLSPAEAGNYVNDNAALVVVDVNKPDYFECPELVYKTKTVIIIDHHLQSGDKIDNLALLHHEPTASSASEMVSEILQYIADDVKLKKIEAESLYAGMLIDTNHFSKNTGVRTFEAAAFLRKNGVDVARVKMMFNDSMEEAIAKAETIRTAEVVEGKFAIVVCPSEHLDNPAVVAAQVANDLLDVRGIEGSFALADIGGRVYISARSTGNVNVQLIMERMGGGGHLNTAGAQIAGSSVDEVKKQVKLTIRKMIEEGVLS